MDDDLGFVDKDKAHQWVLEAIIIGLIVGLGFGYIMARSEIISCKKQLERVKE